MLTIQARTTGGRRDLIPRWQLPLHDIAPGGSPLTLRELIEGVVRQELVAFRERQSEQRLVRVLSSDAIARGVERGRVDLGGRELDQQVDDDEAVGVALESFEDGVYLVLIDERRYESLDEHVLVAEDSRVTFLRLVALAGG